MLGRKERARGVFGEGLYVGNAERVPAAPAGERVVKRPRPADAVVCGLGRGGGENALHFLRKVRGGDAHAALARHSEPVDESRDHLDRQVALARLRGGTREQKVLRDEDDAALFGNPVEDGSKGFGKAIRVGKAAFRNARQVHEGEPVRVQEPRVRERRAAAEESADEGDAEKNGNLQKPHARVPGGARKRPWRKRPGRGRAKDALSVSEGGSDGPRERGGSGVLGRAAGASAEPDRVALRQKHRHRGVGRGRGFRRALDEDPRVVETQRGVFGQGVGIEFEREGFREAQSATPVATRADHAAHPRGARAQVGEQKKLRKENRASKGLGVADPVVRRSVGVSDGVAGREFRKKPVHLGGRFLDRAARLENLREDGVDLLLCAHRAADRLERIGIFGTHVVRGPKHLRGALFRGRLRDGTAFLPCEMFGRALERTAGDAAHRNVRGARRRQKGFALGAPLFTPAGKRSAAAREPLGFGAFFRRAGGVRRNERALRRSV